MRKNLRVIREQDQDDGDDDRFSLIEPVRDERSFSRVTDPYELAPINERDRQIHNAMVHVIKKQSKFIVYICRKHQLLRIIVLIMALLLFLMWFSGGQCVEGDEGLDKVEKMCMHRHTELGCGNEKKGGSTPEQCQLINLCLRNTKAFKQKMEQKEWQQMVDMIFDVLDFGRRNIFWSFILALCLFIYRYLEDQ